ncbi:MAG: GEVED domain-containing protein, partial [Sediminibacterium sp.]|nr:GEVED domain-containing protein [Sediminibacterium sp.]
YYDSSIVYTIQPSISNKVDSVVIDGVNMGTNMEYTLSNVKQNRRIWVYISKKRYSIDISSNISGGLSKVGNNIVSYGDSLFTTISPIVGKYYLDSVVIDTLVVDSASLYYSNYTFKNVRENHTIFAVYSLQVIDSVYSVLQSVNIVGVGSVNNVLKKVVIKRSSNTLPTKLTKLTLNLAGTDSVQNISAIKLWFTGNMDTFVTQNQIGSSIINPNSNKQVFDSINQALLVGENYCWVSYNVAGTAKIGGKINYNIDTVFTDNYLQPSIVLNNPSTNIYSVIQGVYCASNASFTSNEKIYNVQIGTLNNTSSCGVEPYNANSISNQFTDYTTLEPPVLIKGLRYPISLRGGTCNGIQNLARFGVYIDFNQNGYFEESDLVYSSVADTSTQEGKTYTGNITIPSTSQTGAVRMRVIYIQGNTLPANGCGVYGYGKTEDYNLIIQPNKLQSITTIQDSTVIKTSSIIYKSTNVVPILKVPLVYVGVGKNTLDKLSFLYTGSNIQDISQALLYKGTSTNYSKLISTKLVQGNADITFTNLQDSLLNSLNGGNNDTSYYWLVYTLNSPVKSGDTIDSRFNYATISDVNYTPTVADPVGNVVVNKYAHYLSTIVSQIDSISVEAGKTVQLLKLNIRIDSTGIPMGVTKIWLNANYSTSAARDILYDSIYYVGSTDSFYINNNVVRGKIGLLNGNNYFYVQTKLSNAAVANAFIDLGIDSIILADTGSSKYIPTVVNPTGKNKILGSYCMGNLSPKDTVTKTMYVNINGVINNRDLCGGSDTLDYTRTRGVISVLKGTQIPIGFYTNLCIPVNKQLVSTLVLIDWNNNGSFLDAGDSVYGNNDTITSSKPQSFNVLVPCWASNGVTRVRILQSISKQLTVQNQCSNFVGTVQDYSMEILDNPIEISILERQERGSYAVGSNNNVIMQLPIGVKGCGLVYVDSLKSRPIGSTNPIIINTVKLYSSNNQPFFSTNRLLSTKSTGNLGLPANPNI